MHCLFCLQSCNRKIPLVEFSLFVWSSDPIWRSLVSNPYIKATDKQIRMQFRLQLAHVETCTPHSSLLPLVLALTMNCLLFFSSVLEAVQV